MAHIEHHRDGQIQLYPLNSKVVTYILDDQPALGTSLEFAPKVLAGFYHSRRHFILVSLRSQEVFVNRCKVTMFKIIREGDELGIGPHTVVFREITMEVLNSDSALVVSGEKCLVDGRAFKANDSVVYCPACGCAHHVRCWHYQKARCANGKTCQYQGPWAEPAATPS